MAGAALDVEAVRRGAETPETADRAALELAAQDLAAAFVHDPLFDWFMRDDARRDAARLAMFRLILTARVTPPGEVQRPAAGGAAAVWIPSEALAPPPLWQELRALPVLLGASGLRRFDRLAKLRDAMDRHHPTDAPHDYLWFLGVHPKLQGHGVGSRLIAARTARLDAAGRPAFLETATPRNVTLYARHGFEVRAQYRPAPDAPLIWAMWRDPRVVERGRPSAKRILG